VQRALKPLRCFVALPSDTAKALTFGTATLSRSLAETGLTEKSVRSDRRLCAAFLAARASLEEDAAYHALIDGNATVERTLRRLLSGAAKR
jgi:hypothetical protein